MAGKKYIIGRGFLTDNDGKDHHKGAVIDFDMFSSLHDREKMMIENGTLKLYVPGKTKPDHVAEFLQEKAEFENVKKLCKEELSDGMQNLKEKQEKLEKDRKAFEAEKADFEKSKKKK
jgi:hypothetical protein